MRFCWCTVHVRDIEASVKFYEEIVGLKTANRISAGPVQIAFLGDGETLVELIQDGNVFAGGGISLGFTVASLQESLNFVKQKGLHVTGPFEPNPHTRFFFVKDPNGLSVQFVEQK